MHASTLTEVRKILNYFLNISKSKTSQDLSILIREWREGGEEEKAKEKESEKIIDKQEGRRARERKPKSEEEKSAERRK